MGITIRVPGATFTTFYDRAVPYLDQAVGYWLFGGDESTTAKNLAPNATAPQATVVGTPAYNEKTVELTNTSYIDTGVVLDTSNNDWTMIALATRSYDAYCGTWYDGYTDSMLYSTSQGFKATRAGGAALPFIPDDTPADTVRFMAGTANADIITSYLHDGTNLLSEGASLGSPTPNPGSYIIGPFGGLGDSGDKMQRHAAHLLFPVALTAQQIQEVYGYFSFKMGQRGVILL